MTISYVQTNDNKYVQARCMAQNFTTDVTKWQGVDDEPTAESENLVKSGGVEKVVSSKADIKDAEEGISDLAVSDEEGYVIAELKNGGVRTKDFDSTKTPNIIDGINNGDFILSDSANNAVLVLRNGHIATKNFNSENITKKEYIRRTTLYTEVDCSLPSSVDNTNINYYQASKIYSDVGVLYLPASYTPNGEKTKLIIFCKPGNTKITSTSDQFIAQGGDMQEILCYFLSLGYAIMAMDGTPNGWATELGFPDGNGNGNYAAVQSTKIAYDYVIDNYNIDDKGCFIYGYSQGSWYGQNVIDNTDIPILAAILQSPVVSLKYHLWETSYNNVTIDGVTYTGKSRLSIARIFDFGSFNTNEGLWNLAWNQDKVCGYDPWVRNAVDVYNGFEKGNSYGSYIYHLPQGTSIDDITMKKYIKCPMKIWCAENDSILGVDVMKVFAKAAKNAGCECEIVSYSTGDHYLQQAILNSTPIGSFTENGVTYNLRPMVFDMALWMYKNGGIKSIV